MKVSISNPTNNSFTRAAVHGLIDANLLFKYYSSVVVYPGSLLDIISSFTPFSSLKRRRFDPALKPFIVDWPWVELGRHLATKANLTALTAQEAGILNVNAVNINLDKRVASSLKEAAKHGLSAIYSYEDIATFSFREANRIGLKCLYDLPVGYWRAYHKLLQIEKERWPEWIPTLTGFNDSESKLARKDEDLSLADRIFVASTFTANTLKEYPGKLAPIEIIPYGFPAVNTGKRTYLTSKPLKILFVGSLSQRKGIADLFAAVENLKPHVELTVVGNKVNNACPALDMALAKHRWIPTLPNHEILALMRQQDVLAFPSLFEGFGLVITEAMSQGTPVITTDRTAGPDFIKHGQNGWLVQAGSTQALQAAIEELLYNPRLIPEVGCAALETARHRTWEIYGQELANAIKKIL